ncbi:MmcQ/YjbR family DNA-binding protein [Acidicapsa dinghuensis]|uniref:MmcQ/YjbR family DNA-binding protein n=1 Tax=Acidicapsa dinghuensis TaxID=2218256 RepID=A0ABW1EC01_9BACT|nr:MmcQ/YjbR family DNA-binding protein [Acidicapsa dinghuensis]
MKRDEKAVNGDDRLAKISAICLGLPEATCEVSGHHVSFLVRKKVFAYFLDNHHGDGIVGLVSKVLPGDNAALIAADQARFYMPAYVGPRGWVGLRLDVGAVDWDEVAELIAHSYVMVAPKKLAEAVNVEID